MGNEPTIFLKDLDLIKKVEVTDHEHFFDYGIYPTPTSLIFSYPHHILSKQDFCLMMTMQRINLALQTQRVKHGKE